MNTDRRGAVGEALKAARRRTGMSLTTLAVKMGKDGPAGARQISRWETGAEHGAMRVDDLIEFAEACATTPAAILTAAGYGTGADLDSVLRSEPALTADDVEEFEALLAIKRKHNERRAAETPRNATPPVRNPTVAFTDHLEQLGMSPSGVKRIMTLIDLELTENAPPPVPAKNGRKKG